MKPMNLPASRIVPIRDEEGGSLTNEKKLSPLSLLPSLLSKISVEDRRKFVHSIKVGIALVLVSFLYFHEPLYERFHENWMWAIMTVVVVFEFSAGATLSKGLNRGMGTILGGGLGCVSALLAQQLCGISRAVAISISVFIFGAAASYSRLIPGIKKKFEYGVMIFILTFNLVAVSGFRGHRIIWLAGNRLTTILIGFSVCLFTSLFIFPVWAGDELHRSLVSKFDNLAVAIEECLKEYFKMNDDAAIGAQARMNLDKYKSVLHSKSADESLANFARWEPWHGKFGFTYPWNKYLKIGELLRELAASVLQLKENLRSQRQQSPQDLKLIVKEPCEAMGSLMSCALKELGDSIFQMRKCRPRHSIVATLETTSLDLNFAMYVCKLGTLRNHISSIGDELSIASFVFVLMEMANKVEVLAKEVEELGDLAQFTPLIV